VVAVVERGHQASFLQQPTLEPVVIHPASPPQQPTLELVVIHLACAERQQRQQFPYLSFKLPTYRRLINEQK
jgi:hypothetical protein